MGQSPADVRLASRSWPFFLADTHDPQIIPTYAPKGSMYLMVGPAGGREFRKLDDGATTNWVEDVGAVGANLTLSNLVAPTAVNQDLIMNLGKTLILPNDVYLKSKDGAGSGIVDLIKATSDNFIKFGKPVAIANPVGAYAGTSPYDVSPLGAGTYRGVLAFLKTDGTTNQSLRGMQSYIQIVGGNNPTAQHRGLYGVVYNDPSTVQTGALYGVNALVQHSGGILATDMFGLWSQTIMDTSATQARYLRGINLYTQQATGNTQEFSGINSNMDFATPGTTNDLTGYTNNIAFRNGSVGGWVRGVNTNVQMHNGATLASFLYGDINSVNFQSGTVTNAVVGSSQNVSMSSAAVGTSSVRGMDSYVNFTAGTISNRILSGEFNVTMDGGAVSAQDVRAIGSQVQVQTGSVSQNIEGLNFWVAVRNSFTSASQVVGHNMNVSVEAGTIANGIFGATFNVNTSNTFVTTSDVYGVNTNVNLQQGIVTNGIMGVNNSIYLGGAFSGSSWVVGSNQNVTVALGTFSGGINGGNFNVNLQGGFVSANGATGSSSGVTWSVGNLGGNIVGVDGYVNVNTGAGSAVGGAWALTGNAQAQDGIVNELVSYRGWTRAAGIASINNLSGIETFNEVDAAFAGTLNNFNAAVFGYDARCVIPGIGSANGVVCAITNNDGTQPDYVFKAHAQGGAVRTIANPLKIAFGVVDDDGDALTTFSHGLQLYLGVPYRVADIEMALGAKLKNLALNKIDVGANQIKNALDPVDPQDLVTKTYVDSLIQYSSNPYFGGYVNDDGALKTAIAAQKALPATTIENTGVTVNLQNAINAAAPGDVIEIQSNGPYGAITIPGSKALTIRAGSGFVPVFTAANAISLANNVTDVFLIGLKFLNCTTVDANGRGSAISFATHLYQCFRFTVSDCIFERCTGSAVNLSYHMSIAGDNYAANYLLSELSEDVSFVDCTLLRACSDMTEGAAILLRGMNRATIRRCYSDSGDGTGGFTNEGKTRGFMYQASINSIIEDCTHIHARGADEGYKIDMLSPATASFKNTVSVRRCYAEDCVQGFDNDDQGNVNFSQCSAYNCDQGVTMQKATSEGKIEYCILINCNYGVYIGAPVPTATLTIQNNDIFNSIVSNYNLLNGYVLNTNNLEGSRPSILKKLLNASLMTPEGGIAILITNQTGAVSVKGSVVCADTVNDMAVKLAPTSSIFPTGIVYNSGVAVGSKMWVVVAGIADVLLEDGLTSTRGLWLGTSDAVAGRAQCIADPVAVGKHNQEVGHALQTQASGTNVLTKAFIHFN